MSLVNPHWLVWLTQNYDVASETSEYVATVLFQEYGTSSAGTLCCPALTAIENNRFITSQHDSSFNNTHWLYPGLHFALVVGSSATQQKSLTTGIIASQWKFLEINKQVGLHRITWQRFRQTLYEKRRIISKREIFIFFLSRQWGGGLTPKTAPVRTPLLPKQ